MYTVALDLGHEIGSEEPCLHVGAVVLDPVVVLMSASVLFGA